MKKRFVAFALLISAFVVSVSSGCMVRDGYGRGYHRGYHNGYDNGGNHGNYHNGYDHY